LVVKRIRLVNFRNIAEADLTFSGSFNFIFGRNAQGKTNLLEALHLFSLGRSFRTSRRVDMISFGADYSFLSMEAVSDNGVTFVLDIGFDRDGSIRVNQNKKKVAGVSEIIGLIPSVIFTPEDIALAGGEPRHRRFFLDYTASQISASYLRLLKNFKRALKQRNALLKSIANGGAPDGIEEWNEAYAEYSLELVEGRVEVLEKITPRVREQFAHIAGGGAGIELVYTCSFDTGSGSLKEDLRQTMEDVFDAEKRRGYSLVGPQYDDLRISINGNDVRRYGSQGQKRMVSIVLKLAQAVAIMEERGERPVVLLDDIMSELDDEKARKLRSLLSDSYQSFLTSPHMEDFPEEMDGAAFFIVEGGVVKMGR